jgi:hypothetical protein
MKVGDRNFRTIWLDAADSTVVQLIGSCTFIIGLCGIG